MWNETHLHVFVSSPRPWYVYIQISEQQPTAVTSVSNIINYEEQAIQVSLVHNDQRLGTGKCPMNADDMLLKIKRLRMKAEKNAADVCQHAMQRNRYRCSSFTIFSNSASSSCEMG